MSDTKQLVAEGTHTGVAVRHNVQWGKTPAGNEQVVVPIKIKEGEYAGRTLTWFGFFTEKTWARTMDALRYMGWRSDDISDLGALDKEVEIVVTHETYEGETRARIQWVNEIGGGRIKLHSPMDAKELRMFAASMRSKAQGKMAKAQGSDQPPHAADDDDLPF